MRLRGLLWFNAVFSIMPVALLASAIVEGQVELPKSHTAPIQAKRYEIVTTPRGNLSRRCFAETSFAADETGRAKRFDVRSSASPSDGWNQG